MLWTRLLAQLRGEKDRSTLMAKRNYLRHSKSLDKAKVSALVGEYDDLRHQAERFYGEWNTTLRHMEDITLGIQHNHAVYLDDFAEQNENLIARLEGKYNKNMAVEEWDVLDRNIYSNTHERLASYFYRKGDVVRASQCNQKAQDGWDNGDWHKEVERLLVQEGRADEAEKISWTRLESLYWNEVQASLTKRRS